MLACADIEEGIVLRQAGVRVPILVFGALSVSDLDGLFEFALTPTISTPGAARAVQAAAATARDDRSAYHLKIDTGMNRLGFRHDNLRRTLPELLASAEPAARSGVHALRVRGRARESGVQRPARAVRRSVDGRAWLQPSHEPGLSRDASVRHACNSAALLRDSRVWYDAVRPGLLLYGIVPPPLASTIPLHAGDVADQPCRCGQRPAAGRRRRLRLAIQADAPRTIAVVPAGYADGLDTRLCGRGHVLIRGRRVPIVGAVSMDMITVDVTEPRRRAAGRRSGAPRTAGQTRAGSRSTRARWRPRSARSRGRSSAGSARGSSDNTTRPQACQP